MRFKEVNYTLSKLVDDIAMGEIGLPELQRPFVWPNKMVRDQFDSMYKGYQHTATMNRGERSMSITVVPDSKRGVLS